MFIRLVCFACVSCSFDFEHQQGGLLVIKPARYQGKEERFSPPKLQAFFPRRGGVGDNPVKKKKNTPHTGATLSPSCWLWMCAEVLARVKRCVCVCGGGSKCVLRSARHTMEKEAALTCRITCRSSSRRTRKQINIELGTLSLLQSQICYFFFFLNATQNSKYIELGSCFFRQTVCVPSLYACSDKTEKWDKCSPGVAKLFSCQGLICVIQLFPPSFFFFLFYKS